MSRASCLAGLIALVALNTTAEEPPIGRLFGLAQRADGNTVSARQVRVDGVLLRSSQRNTLWLNGQVQNEYTPGPYRINADASRLPEIRLNERYPVRIGETLDLDTGERRDTSGVSPGQPARQP